MDETPAQIESRIRHTRDELSANVSELKHRVAAATQWRTYYERSPGVFLATALGSGVLLALATRRASGDIVTRATYSTSRMPRKSEPLPASLTVIKGALIGLAVDRAKAMLLDGSRSRARMSGAGRPKSAAAMPNENDGSTVIG